MLAALAMALAVAILLGFLLPVPANARCIRAPNSPICERGADPAECEELCITTSDGAFEPYTDGRRRRQQFYRERAAAEQRTERRREYIQHFRDRRDGAQHTSDMASGGTMHGSILVSPYVPEVVRIKAGRPNENVAACVVRTVCVLTSKGRE